jgi:hypothetical protein
MVEYATDGCENVNKILECGGQKQYYTIPYNTIRILV